MKILILLLLVSCAGTVKQNCKTSAPFTPCVSSWRPTLDAPHDPVFNPNKHNGQPVIPTRN